MLKIGITERGDPSYSNIWINKMSDVNGVIIITKNLTDNLISNILEFKNKIILHSTIIGYGKTEFEPNVNSPDLSFQQLYKLINFGFPVKNIVLRIDPIIPQTLYSRVVENVLEKAKILKLKRIRISFINMYPYVINRLRNAELLKYMRYTTFNCPDYIKYEILDYLSEKYGDFQFELCADICNKQYNNIYQVGCISQKDLDILSLGDCKNQLIFDKSNRKNCLCPKNKIELLNDMHPCKNNCIYCYWKKDNEK